MRAINYAIAAAGGYFWLPCVLCGVHYGGHEAGSGAVRMQHHPMGTARGVCRACTRKYPKTQQRPSPCIEDIQILQGTQEAGAGAPDTPDTVALSRGRR